MMMILIRQTFLLSFIFMDAFGYVNLLSLRQISQLYERKKAIKIISSSVVVVVLVALLHSHNDCTTSCITKSLTGFELDNSFTLNSRLSWSLKLFARTVG